MVDGKRALVVGVTGISGNNTAPQLLAEGWEVRGLSRSGTAPESAIHPVAVDLLDAAATRRAVAGLRPTHVFSCTWQRRATEAENCEVNAAMMGNLLEPLIGWRSSRPGGTPTAIWAARPRPSRT